MTEPAWHSQTFPPEGASAAEGIRNQLGRPELDLLTILVRESAQNSWDARTGDTTVDYHLDLKVVSPAHAPAWRELLTRRVPAHENLPLRQAISSPAIRVLTVSDRGTTGLGGPTRADNAVVENHDFVSFIRNIGEPRDTELGGGTYGFGKGIFYLLSKPGTVLVHTRCKVPGGFETRLMGCALWKSYAEGEGLSGRRYTGRHWWGAASADGVVEPLVGAEADAVAERLGLRAFGSQETGTTVVVIDPDLGEREIQEAGEYLAETIAWNLWPKMLTGSDGGIPPMRFSVQCDGITVPVPDPRETTPLDMFVAAHEAMQSDADHKELRCYNPKAKLGNLGLEKRFVSPFAETPAGVAAGIGSTVHHVCLMRTAELVVTYHAGPKPPAEYVSYAGVFRADAELDSAFAASEPPTHDAWHWQSLEGRDKTFVKTTFTRIKEHVEELIDVDGRVKTGSSEIALGAASRTFSDLVAGSWGIGGASDYRQEFKPVAPAAETGASQRSGDLFDSGAGGDAGASSTQGPGVDPEPGSSNGRRPRVEYLDSPSYEIRAGHLVLIQAFRIATPGLHRCVADLGVALAGTSSRETDPPRGADEPQFFGWEGPDGALRTEPSQVLEGSDDVWRVLVRPAPDTTTEITVTARREEALR
ncbi:hypothetical protein QRX50_08765 [Amycolatopsis carbonis]|uniref:Uncharacterized protein n=1 Tax=Amycolatopsis carbonis TaxID=715471 RepID=A0A9Y2ILK0_9PSEU|nr:hypothetical protein [Amycolatopsis sp. 2-15]WIX80838.1 hypothetical protein QRX50_08765 [Amycolatopsis sp. 2-15]